MKATIGLQVLIEEYKELRAEHFDNEGEPYTGTGKSPHLMKLADLIITLADKLERPSKGNKLEGLLTRFCREVQADSYASRLDINSNGFWTICSHSNYHKTLLKGSTSNLNKKLRKALKK